MLRCRRFVAQQGELCFQHRNQKVKPVSPPDIILVKIKTNPVQIKKFAQFGLSVVDRVLTKRLLEKKRIKQAEELRRSPFSYNPEYASSGTAVFGPKGIYQVSIEWQEIFKEYGITDIYLEKEEQGIRKVVVVLELGKKTAPFPLKLFDLVICFFESTWGICVVWANPPNEKGEIVHTLKLFCRQPNDRPQLHLFFNHGLWAVKPPP